jgi:general secretion pathway protein D
MASATAVCAADDQTIRIDFPESVQLSVLTDYVGQRLGLNIIYDQKLASARLTLKFTTPIRKDDLLGVYRSALQFRGLALIETDQSGVLKIIDATDFLINLPEISTTRPADRAPPDRPGLTQVVRIEHADIGKLSGILGKFMTPRVGNIMPIPDSRLLVITDYTSKVLKVLEVIELLDVPAPPVELVLIPAEHVAADKLAGQISKVLTDEQAVRGVSAEPKAARITADQDGRNLIVIGQPDEIQRIRELAALFDVGLDLDDRMYPLRHLPVDRAKSLLEALLKGAPDTRTRSERTSMHADTASNVLIVWADGKTHEKIGEYLHRFDQPEAAAGARQLRVYPLINVGADQVAHTLQGLLQAKVVVPVTTGPAETAAEFAEGYTDTAPVGPNLPPVIREPDLPKPPAHKEPDAPAAPVPATAARPTDEKPEDIIITAEPNTNALLVVASPTQHAQIESLLKILDRRRPQVLVEVLLVIVDSSNSFSLGIELTEFELDGVGTDYLLFTSFGLSDVNPETGERSLTATAGLNTAIIRPDYIPFILKTLASEASARVISAPRILVSDNTSGTLNATSEQPFTSVNASSTVATTSFAGYAQAGTRVSVRPRISEGDYVEMDYSISLSSFSGAGAAGVPPPRSSNSLSGQVKVPDGYTVIVGGLTTEQESQTTAKIPLLADIPFAGVLFRSTTRTKNRSTVYAFIKPLVLRDDRFEDLKYISTADLARADIQPEDVPVAEPQWMDVTE